MATNYRVEEVETGSFPFEHLRPALTARRFGALSRRLSRARAMLAGRTVWHVNSTATGGGVAEMLAPMTACMRGLGLDARWVVISGDPAFFELTKRIHNGIHGVNGRYRPEDRRTYERVTAANARQLVRRIRSGDVVICHDPQTAGMVPHLVRAGAIVVWRSHIGHDDPGAGGTGRTWSFLEPWIRDAHAVVFSREAYVPAALRELPHLVIHPSIDPRSVKNMPMGTSQVRALLVAAGLVAGKPNGTPPEFVRADGSVGRVTRRAIVLREGEPPVFGTPIVLQVSRWDRLKDPVGVMRGFARHVGVDGVHLYLAGPDVSGVTDDPEGAEVLAEVQAEWRSLPDAVRARVHVVSLPMDDVEENAAVVNALQRHSRVIVQKSLYEGFGLTVTEAMWKARPVVASAVGGIQDQIVSGTHGVLIVDPTDLRAYGAAVRKILLDRPLARRLGRNARDRVRSRFLLTRHLVQWLEFLPAVVDRAEGIGSLPGPARVRASG